MCGIVGIVDAKNPIDINALCRARDALTHRGPDDADVWTDAERGVGLAHRRLSIIDLSPKGRQPMVSADGSLVLIFNGVM